MIVVDRLSKSFKTRKGTQQVLREVSFTAPDGEVFGLLGPNGAGKTTTLRCIATLIRPDSGTVSVGGLDVGRESRAVRDGIGFLTGDMKLTGQLSSRQMLRFFGELNHMEKREVGQRIGSLSEKLDMEDFLDKPIALLSSGMVQKTSIAVSLIHNPHTIIFDEPTSNLDVLSSKVVVDFLRASRNEGKCVILSTHMLSEAERLCDRIGIMHQGRLLCCAHRDELLEQYHCANLEDLFFNLVRGGEETACSGMH